MSYLVIANGRRGDIFDCQHFRNAVFQDQYCAHELPVDLMVRESGRRVCAAHLGADE